MPPLLLAIQYPRQSGVVSKPTTVWTDATGVGEGGADFENRGAHDVVTRSRSRADALAMRGFLNPAVNIATAPNGSTINASISGGTPPPESAGNSQDVRCAQLTGTQL